MSLLIKKRRIVCTIEELYDQHKFRKNCLVKLGSMPSMMKREDWDYYITDIVSKAIKVQSEFEMTPEGEFRNVLTRYISNQANAMDIDDILNGQCFVDDEERKVYFRMDQLSRVYEKQKIWHPNF